MSQSRRLGDTLQKFREAREDLIREMGVSQPLSASDSSRQVSRLRDLHDVIEIMKAAVADAQEVHLGRENREAAKASPDLRRAALDRQSWPLPDEPFRPL